MTKTRCRLTSFDVLVCGEPMSLDKFSLYRGRRQSLGAGQYMFGSCG